MCCVARRPSAFVNVISISPLCIVFRMGSLEKKAGANSGSNNDLQGLLDHYRSKVKCHCKMEDKARVLPCGHGICARCVEGLIKDRSRKCPSCGKKFDQAEVKNLYLMGGDDA